MTHQWTCNECGWQVTFSSKAKVFKDCPLCEYDIYDREPPGKHTWMSPQKALQTLQKGEPLSRVFVEQLPLDKHSFTEAVRINDCVIQSLSGRGSSFEKGLKADTCTFLDTVSLGAGQVQGDDERVADIPSRWQLAELCGSLVEEELVAIGGCDGFDGKHRRPRGQVYALLGEAG